MNERELGALGPVPLPPEAERRIRARLAQEVERRRAELLEGALYGGFAVAAVAWALLMVVR